ncbi:MAG: ABC transporter ATP-binding protein [Termitinemataceae bacterium]|nr:MAG: ABC transporter ATP-binding protein [Termitinemataceae bacterium]
MNKVTMSYIEFEKVSKYYTQGLRHIDAANELSFCVERNEFCAIVGPSGAGKTTLLNILGGMDTCNEGRIMLDGVEISALSERQLTDYRRFDVGFVFQFYNLIQNLTALENVELASEICPTSLDPKQTLQSVGLGDRLDNFPSQLSGGEQQRVAIARSLAKNPKVLLCDEPTGALDYETGKAVLQILHDSCKKSGKTVIIITHNLAIAGMADRVIHVKNGQIQDVNLNPNPLSVAQVEW